MGTKIFLGSSKAHCCRFYVASVVSNSVRPHRRLTAAAKSLQSCPTLCDPRDGSPPGSPIPGILQARTLEWVAISSSNVWKWKVKVKSLSRVQLCATPWTAAQQAPLSMGFSRQECWSGCQDGSLGTLNTLAHLMITIWRYSNCFCFAEEKHWSVSVKVDPFRARHCSMCFKLTLFKHYNYSLK